MAILSIQSHVVYGYAGNTAAVFPLQRLGHEVWAINTVEFSNHTGYGEWSGVTLGADFARDIISGLDNRNVLSGCKAVLSGYLGDAAVGMVISDTVKKIRRKSAGLLYCCDPVMGDSGCGLYVKPDIPDIFINELVPLADIVCPNQFEIEILTGIKIDNIDNARHAVEKLHKMGPAIVLLTSYKEKDGYLSMIASDKNSMYKITTSELSLGSGVAGTGDLTSAVFLSRYLETGNIEKTLELCTASIFGILEFTYKSSLNSDTGLNKNNFLELKIIDAQQELVNPSYFFKAQKL